MRGTDRIQSSISYSLNVSGRFDVENLTLTGTAAINGLGNARNNMMVGNSAENVLSAGAGNDSLFGQAGDDALLAGAGSDTLNGGIGADTMNGDVGNDTYFVDNAGDVVIEAVPGGSDRILSSISQDLTVGGRANVENLTLTGAAAINGTGNALSNVMVGNNADNVLSGLGNSDQLLGLDGNDSLSAGDGNDLVNGGLGSDVIQTGAGVDRVFFNSALGAGNVDAVQDFIRYFDTLPAGRRDLSALAPGTLAAEAFVVGAARSMPTIASSTTRRPALCPTMPTASAERRRRVCACCPAPLAPDQLSTSSRSRCSQGAGRAFSEPAARIQPPPLDSPTARQPHSAQSPPH